MSGKFIHKRRDIVQISFPNNRLSTRFPRRKKTVTKRVWKEEESSAYFGVPNSALFTPFDIPNPTDNAPKFSHTIHYSDAGGYAPAQPLRAGEWGDGHDAIFEQCEKIQTNERSEFVGSGGAVGGGLVQSGGVLSYPAQPFECNENGHRRHPQGGVGECEGTWKVESHQVASQRSLRAPVITSSDGDGLYDGPNVDYTYTLDGKSHRGENYTTAYLGKDATYTGDPYKIWGDDGILDAQGNLIGAGNGVLDIYLYKQTFLGFVIYQEYRYESWLETNPLNPDSDGDSANDGQEAVSGYKLIKMETRGQEVFDTEVLISASAAKALDPYNFELKNGKYQWRDVDDDGISDYNETHYDVAYPEIVNWANAKSLETGGEFNATEYLTNQFNPFVAENIPPMITRVEIDSWDDWGWSWGLPVVEASWSKIDVWAMDVADFTIIMGVKDRNSYLAFNGLGGGIERYFTATIEIDYWADSLAEYYVNVTVTDTVGNVVYFEKEVAGFFGGIMNFLEDVWNGICGAFEAAWEAVKAAMTWILDYIKGIIMGAINGFINWIQTMIKNAISGIVNAMIQSWKALGGANLNDLTSSLLLFPLVIGAAITSGKTLINNIKNALLAIKTVEAGISALMMAITGGGSAALKIVLQQAAKEVMTKGFITATIMASAATIGIGAIETFSDGFFSNTLGIIFKSFVGGTLIVSACMDVYSNLQKEKISPQEKRSYVAALVLTGLFIEVFGGDLLSSALTGLGVESPFAKGILAMTLDVGGLILAAFGLQKFFKSNPTEKAWNVFEEIWSGITTSAEDTITILGFIGAVVGATFNAASGNWQWWEVSP